MGNFVESKSGRRVTLKGINLDSSMKIPTSPPHMTSYRPFKDGLFWDGDNVSFVGRPFPIEEAEEHFNRIKSWGYNTIRYIITWEAIEHFGPGHYDDEFVEYTIKILKIIDRIGGLYVFIDPHQDVWSRFTGGCGAPLWTLYAAGLNPHKFATTEAAFIQNSYPDPINFPKMVWPTNYTRLATFTMFTMFFSGKKFFPKCIIDGVNIQDYLQSHFLNSLKYFLVALESNVPKLMNTTIIGFETLNEPSCGLYGRQDLSVLPKDQELRVHTTPTAFEAMKLGMGIPCEIDTYEIRIIGPTRTGKKLVNEQKDNCWIKDYKWDDHYGFKRDKNWKIGQCVYALHGIWDIKTETLLIPDYFGKDPNTGTILNKDVFVNEDFLDFYISSKQMLRSINSDLFSMMQIPVFEIPPNLMNTDIVDNRTILCQHYYDGMSLMFKTWNRKYNVDTLGILRGRYLNPIFGIVFGEKNIRRCIKNQFNEMNREKIEYMGRSVPMMISETGMPFDMDDKKSFDDGDYSSQISALDCIGYALETNNLSHTYWCYSSINCHKWGDRWNNEDFGFWSKDDCKDWDYTKKMLYDSTRRFNTDRTFVDSIKDENISSSKRKMDFESDSTVTESILLKDQKQHVKEDLSLFADGVRSLDSIVRPYPVLINGTVEYCEFDLSNLTFELIINTKSSSNIVFPSVIYLPSFHFPIDDVEIQASTGTTKYKFNDFLQVLHWHHDINIGKQRLYVQLNQNNENKEASALNFSACGCGSGSSGYGKNPEACTII
ncbi:hypothetical protein PACTADRAFT_49842 [Pachysolen tannophilus NRRL Y-2460]|uniref:Glycoside hydrolase family 5 C-terminal domain-containing protein n=1 Tax=Pachysolen tannophilus NRRL Y-2460 TaxID=669874 RepID=A0A1E4TXN0_PACTA|nr:hypothetical protein PACTADRAFT_49842 [Pachysolen tannophilus NRRL Y-2460]